LKIAKIGMYFKILIYFLQSWIGIFKKALIGAAEIILFSAVAGHWLAVSPAAASA